MRCEIYRKTKSSVIEVVKSESHIRHPGAISCMTLQTRAVKKETCLMVSSRTLRKSDGRRLMSVSCQQPTFPETEKACLPFLKGKSGGSTASARARVHFYESRDLLAKP